MDENIKKQIIKKFALKKRTKILISATFTILLTLLLGSVILISKSLNSANTVQVATVYTSSPVFIPTPYPTITNSPSPTQTPRPVPTPTPTNSPSATPVPTPTPFIPHTFSERVFVVTYYSGQNPNNSYDYNSLATNIANDLNIATKFHGYLNPSTISNINFQIVKRTLQPKTAPQLGNNCDQYLSKVQSGQWQTSDWKSTNCWGSGTADYNQMLLENSVCDLVNSNQIDEVWFMGFGNAGFWEANMTGNGAFWTNGPVVTNTNCGKPTHIMGFNYELSPDYALHSMGHRIEGISRNFFPSDSREFMIYAPNGNSSCGNVHFPPNGNADYDYGDEAQTNSDCENWNYNHTGTRQNINCPTWGCNQLGYMTWW